MRTRPVVHADYRTMSPSPERKCSPWILHGRHVVVRETAGRRPSRRDDTGLDMIGCNEVWLFVLRAVISGAQNSEGPSHTTHPLWPVHLQKPKEGKRTRWRRRATPCLGDLSAAAASGAERSAVGQGMSMVGRQKLSATLPDRRRARNSLAIQPV